MSSDQKNFDFFMYFMGYGGVGEAGIGQGGIEGVCSSAIFKNVCALLFLLITFVF
ncbi:MAG: hypothetical protein P8104_03715 [Gammaproteobacteria bacterium]